ncbi:uncharacterized protein LOC111113518 isoform X1 [Crassostrea virginica]
MQVSNLLETPSSRRKIITLKDPSGVVEMKAWGDMATNLQIEAEQMVKISCVTIDQYLNRCSLNTNPSTTVEVLNEEEEIEGIIDAACLDQDMMSVLIEEQLYKVDIEVMTRLYPSGEFTPGVEIHATVKGRSIVEVFNIRRPDEENH